MSRSLPTAYVSIYPSAKGMQAKLRALGGPSVKLNRAGARQLLRSPEVMRMVRERGDAIAAAAGPGHEVQERVGKNRDRVTVRTATWSARYHEATGRNLTRAFEAGRRG